MPETAETLGDPTCPAFAQPNILARMASLFTAPAGLDRMGAVKVSTRQRAFEICEWSAKQGRPLHVLWGKVGNPKNTEHYGGLGVDFMTFSNAALTKHDRAIGDGIVEYMLANRTRLKLKGLIWRQRRIGYSSGWDSWVAMSDRGSATANHYDHVHGLFADATYVPPGPAKPLPVYYVDPEKVTTTLIGNPPAGKKAVNLPPRTAITNAVSVDGDWVVTTDGYRFHKGYLTTVEPAPPVTVPPVTTPPVEPPAPVLPTYKVKAGDTLRDIAARIGTTWQKVAALNPGLNPDKIRVGQTLTVPKAVPPVVKPPTPKPTPEPEPTVTHTVTVAGFNILRETDTMKGRKRWPQRRSNVIKHLKSAKASVAILCEVDKSTAEDVGEGLGWSYYPSGYNTGKEFSPLAILWDPNVWRREKDAFVEEYSDNENRFLMRLPLVHKASGKEVWFYSSHLENDGDTQTDGHRARKVETTEWAKWTLDGPGVFYADLNSTTRSGSNDTAREREKPRPILKGAGWKFLTDQAGVTNRHLESHHGGLSKPSDNGPWIDDMGFKGVTYVQGALIRTDGTDASDHNLLTLTVKL